jgi:NAD(P)-dependent dehydrogenase (short-subunit alcohol dehydrogenase family)
MIAQERVLVVGGSSGIGWAVAQRAARSGAQVLIAARGAERVKALAESLPGALPLVMDMLDPASVQRAADEAGEVHHVVLTAVGDEYGVFGDIASVSDAQIDASFAKVRGYVNVVRAVAPTLVAKGSLTLLSGAGALRPPRGTSLAAGANAALVGLARAWAVELAPRRVNVVMPGPVETTLHGDALANVRRFAEGLPAQHFSTAGEIAEAVDFIMHAPAATGSVLLLDGGLHVA